MATESNILQKDWSEIHKVLKNSKPVGDSRSVETPDEKALRSYFGSKKFETLRDYAKEGDKTRQKLGNVILLPGIMGSTLMAVDKNGGESSVWLSLMSLAFGGLSRLELSPDGKTNKNGETIKPPSIFAGLFRGVMFNYYSLALEALQAEPFSYDWRLDVRASARQLANFIRQKFFGQEVSLVAHSMGGLVARSFIFQYPDLWETMKGRMIMLGTPNRGSFDAVQALIGENRTIKKLDRFDIRNDKESLMRVFHSFPGLYHLLPGKDNCAEVYQRATWNNYATINFETHLQDVERLHQELTAPATIDPKRMFYIAGTGFETTIGLKSITDGQFNFETTPDGDGTVSHKLGLLDGITTFYDKENEHSDLLTGENTLTAVRELIATGKTEALPTVKPEASNLRLPKKGAKAEDLTAEEEVLVDIILGSLRSGETLEDRQIAEIERQIFRSVIGGKDIENKVEIKEKTTPRKIHIELIERDISESTEEVIAVGKYSDLPPRGACSAIDKKLDYRISLAHQSGMIGSELGQLFFVPDLHEKPPAASANEDKIVDPKESQKIILAGTGSYGKFSRDDLRYLIMNVALAVQAINKNRFMTVMIGTGLDDFSIDRAVRSILSGVADAIDRFPYRKEPKKSSPEPDMTVVICESNPVRFDNLLEVVKDLEAKQKNGTAIENVTLLFDEEKDKHALTAEQREANEIKAKKAKVEDSEDLPFFVLNDKQKNVTRITVERDYEKERFSLSALTSTAAIPVREIAVQNCVIDSLIEKIRRTRDREKQKKYGRLLHSILIPEDFQGLIDANKPLVLLLNGMAAAVPWEMICYGGSRGFSTFGVELQLSRQFSMASASIPSVQPPLNDTLKVLIIANPAAGDLNLEGAAREGRELKAFFEEFNARSEVKVLVDSCIGPLECDIVDVLTKIFTEDYDIIHFSGHGIYDPKDETNSGWVFGSRKVIVRNGGIETEIEKLIVLSPREIFRLRKVPRLVFANACFSSQTYDGSVIINEGVSAWETNRKLAGIAEAFFARGIENYIGAGWQVNDTLAVQFAEVFYEQAFSKNTTSNKYNTLSDSLGEARKRIKIKTDNSTWGAYQHYGDANTRLVR